MTNFINKLPKKFHWTIHNVVAHPLSEVFWLLNLKSVGNYIHDVTVPSFASNQDTIDPGTTSETFD
jgi:hypothetical protein